MCVREHEIYGPKGYCYHSCSGVMVVGIGHFYFSLTALTIFLKLGTMKRCVRVLVPRNGRHVIELYSLFEDRKLLDRISRNNISILAIKRQNMDLKRPFMDLNWRITDL